jgi:hypothetical protein
MGRKKSAITLFTLSLALASVAMAQDQTAPRPWRSVNDPPPAGASATQPPDAPPSGFDQGAPVDQGGQFPQGPQQPNFQGGPQFPNGPAPQTSNGAPPADNYGIPPRLTIPAGAYVTVRVNGWLSSDRNHQGDSFTATLDQPIVVDGIVVAQRGQTVGGRVTEAQKAGRVEGTSRLGIELTDLTLVDGSNVQVRSQMIDRNGPTSVGRDVGAVAGTTALGAAIGAGVDWGRGAAIGAGAGAAAGILGVLLTRGRPTVIYPETAMTFRLDAPVMVATDRAPQAFRYAEQPDYQRDRGGPGPPRYANGPVPPPVATPYPYYGGYGYAAPYPYPYYYPGFSVYVGPGYGYYRGFRGYGYYRYRR